MRFSEGPPSVSSNSNQEWLLRAEQVLAGGVSSQFRRGEALVFHYGRGSHFWDVDGREYLDYTLSQGPLIHGHSPMAILDRVQQGLQHGMIYSGIHPEEVELAEKLTSIIPGADQVRFSCTGSEADHAAMRLARAYTGRSKIIKFEGHYHGWYDTIVGSINPSLDEAGSKDQPSTVPWTGGLATGSLDDLIVLPWNCPEAVEKVLSEHGDQIAAIITEPCMCNSGCIDPQPGYLEHLRSLCDQYQVILIFDEVITGFRLALGGAQQRYHVMPDLSVFGKAVAGGFPISVLAGRRHVMDALTDGRAIHAGTLNAHLPAVSACLASIELLEEDDSRRIRGLETYTKALMKGIREISTALGLPVWIQGPGPVFHMGFLREGVQSPPSISDYRSVVQAYDTSRYGQFVEKMKAEGIRLIGRGIWYTSTAHTQEDLNSTLAACDSVMRTMVSG